MPRDDFLVIHFYWIFKAFARVWLTKVSIGSGNAEQTSTNDDHVTGAYKRHQISKCCTEAMEMITHWQALFWFGYIPVFNRFIWYIYKYTSRLLHKHSEIIWLLHFTLQWRHNGLDGVSNHQFHHCLLSRLFGRRSKKTSKLCVTGLCAGNSPGTGEFQAQGASNAENVSIWWRHHNWSNRDRYWENTSTKHDSVWTVLISMDWCMKDVTPVR